MDMSKGKRQKKSTAGNQERITRKEIERQRREEMASLYTSLRSVLPPEYIKGKISTSDLIHEATNYIKLKEKNIEGFEKAKRDTLNNFASENDINTTNEGSSSNNLPVDVKVSSYSDGIQILISVDLSRVAFQLSKVLEVLIAEGLGVLYCVCTKSNGRILHIIQTDQVGEGVDIYELEQKLSNLVNTP